MTGSELGSDVEMVVEGIVVGMPEVGACEERGFVESGIIWSPLIAMAVGLECPRGV